MNLMIQLRRLSTMKRYQDSLNLPVASVMEMRPNNDVINNIIRPRLLEIYYRQEGKGQADQLKNESSVTSSSSSSKSKSSDKGVYVVHDGPPYANGTPHLGHALNKILKDMMARHKLITGHSVSFIPGWDCHGLPIEQKALENVKDRDSLTPMEIRKKARGIALAAIEKQKEEFKSWGIMADWQNPYLTMDPKYEASQIGVFAKMVQEGLIYRDFKPVYWSPSSRTALAEAELEYVDDHKSRSVFVSFPLTTKVDGLAEVKLLIWTTTPWTLPANQAVSVNEKLEYGLVEISGSSGYFVVATALIPSLEKRLGKEITLKRTVPGATLLGLRYQNTLVGTEHPVLFGEFVTTESGTGLVHTAPAHGLDDYKVCKKQGMSILSLVDDRGCYTDAAGPKLAGKSVMDQGTAVVVEELQRLGVLLKEEPYSHRYPYDWRTKKPVMLRATEQWFASLSGISEKAITSLDSVEFFPKTGKNRLVGTISSRTDWCISRQRVWGVPIPVFYDENGKPLMTPSSVSHIQQLFEREGSDCWWTMAKEELLAPEYRKEAHRYRKGEDTMDVWFDSGTSWSHLSNRLSKPGIQSLYLEGSDQHRGWFQSSLLTSIAVRGTSPFKTLLTHGFVLDEQGRKMSKSLGNVIEPNWVIQGGKDKNKNPAYGPDVLRMWVSATDYSSDINIGATILGKVAEAHRKIRNSLRFALTNLADFDPLSHTVQFEQLPKLEKYMVSRLGDHAREVTKAYEEANFQQVFRESVHLASVDLSSFYFDMTKDVLYADRKDGHRRRSAQTVLALVAEILTKGVAPITPFLAEEVFESGKRFFQTTPTTESIFLSGWFPTLPTFPAEANDVSLLRQLKVIVNQAVEGKRADGTLTIPAEADVTLTLQPTSHFLPVLQSLDRESTENFFRVSKLSVRTREGTEGAEVEVGVAKTTLTKCPRCWNFTVENPSSEATVCTRCQHALQN